MIPGGMLNPYLKKSLALTPFPLIFFDKIGQFDPELFFMTVLGQIFKLAMNGMEKTKAGVSFLFEIY
jgi:hypothetical protein